MANAVSAAGTQVPHFEVTQLDGSAFAYASIWQNRNLLLVCLHGRPRSDVEQYASSLRAHTKELQALETVPVITTDCVSGLPCPGVTIADRWGEVVHAAAHEESDAARAVDDMLEWLRYVQHRCPECEGEAR